MYLIQNEDVPSWASDGRHRTPRNIDCYCPNSECCRKITFTFYEQWIGSDFVLTNRSRCPACSSSASFILVRERNDSPEFEIYLYPKPTVVRSSIKGIFDQEIFSSNLQRAYLATLEAHNSRQWTASMVLCGRLLEGMLRELMPNSNIKKMLAQQLQDLSAQFNFKKPILEIADGIRKGRNIGAHFNAELEPNEQMASMMLDMIEYMIEYLFIIPSKIEKLHSNFIKDENTD